MMSTLKLSQARPRSVVRCSSSSSSKVAVSKPSVVSKAIKAVTTSTSSKVMVTTVLGNAIVAGSSMAESGALFDFNITLPIMTAQFVTLMVLLDNLWFKPVGAVLDERDEKIRSQLGGVKDNAGDIKRMEEEADETLRSAQKDVAAMIATAKEDAQKECDSKLADEKAKVDRQLASSISDLEAEKAATLANLDEAVSTLSKSIVEKVLRKVAGYTLLDSSFFYLLSLSNTKKKKTFYGTQSVNGARLRVPCGGDGCRGPSACVRTLGLRRNLRVQVSKFVRAGEHELARALQHIHLREVLRLTRVRLGGCCAVVLTACLAALRGLAQLRALHTRGVHEHCFCRSVPLDGDANARRVDNTLREARHAPSGASCIRQQFFRVLLLLWLAHRRGDGRLILRPHAQAVRLRLLFRR
eukprot:CAMPEP_0206132126 /NCGR_PEP_ID=MMETSP1472-20131121/47994_1 /ASSEMBLY_ACC=CAM_ASM_001108 /TAXON_ID=41880 /ORGANISM="Pycnococcus provasolii, Strain RCC251" /LENGTH=411 /DNA_ID=CAMNT_0053523611 /DNA_START=27 /DNA_END=1260 /DNA_ORIENTATION=-